MNPSQSPLILIVAADEAGADALYQQLAQARYRVCGAAHPGDLAQAVRAFAPTLLVAAAAVTLPAIKGLPLVQLEPGDDVIQRVAAAWASATALPGPPGQASPTTEGEIAPPVDAPTPELELRALALRATPVRLGFYGARGGVGTTTAALTTAQLLAERGYQVALCDAPRRGDLHLQLGLTPTDSPTAVEGGMLFTGIPAEAELMHYAAVVVDGGREPRGINVRWVRVERPLKEEEVLKLLGGAGC